MHPFDVQCPTCGREVAELTQGLCDVCMSERKPFLEAPEVLSVTRCAHCRRLEVRGGWIPAPDDRNEFVRLAIPNEVWTDPELAESHLQTDLVWEDERNGVLTLHLTGRYHSNPVERTGESRVRLRQSVCADCSREYGGYFEAIIQVRGSEDRVLKDELPAIDRFVSNELEGLRSDQRTGAWVSRSEQVRGGLDYFVGSHEIARLVAAALKSRYGAESHESSKLVGRKDGRDLYRSTLLVRLPPFVPGDFIRLDDRLFKVLRHDGKRLTLWDLERNARVQREPKRAKSIKVVGRAEDEHDAIVVSRHGRRLQFLDPATFKTVDAEVPAGLEPGETVRVFFHDDEFYVLPSELAKPSAGNAT